MEFYCLDCDEHQCDLCCATAHRSPSLASHVFVAVAGAQAAHYRYAVWGSNFKEMAKMYRREQQMMQTNGAPPNDNTARALPVIVKQEAPSSAARPMRVAAETTSDARSYANLGDMETDDEGESEEAASLSVRNRAMEIKMERVHLEDAPSIEAPSASAPIKMERPVAAGTGERAPRRQPSHDVVDLTEDDDTGIENAPHHNVLSREPQPRIKTESEWLKHATQQEQATDAYAATVVDEDPILAMMIHEYNQKSEAIFLVEQEIARVTEGLRQSVSSFSAGSLDEANRIRDQLSTLKNSLTKEKHSRNAIVARLVVFQKASSPDLAALLDSATVDIPDAQTASHRKCAAIEAAIREKHDTLRQLKRDMDDAIRLKGPRAYEEVTRLGVQIAQDEAAVRQLHADRLEEFVTLCRFSQHIQNAARSMMAAL
ncbi:hypothetical protein PINS_up003212 [Pythium insidiosum]|nr:hypothetical protein PINS_up003212 [Pythium insidiosum]